MLKHKMAVVDRVEGDDAQACAVDSDSADARASVRGSSVLLEIACELNGASVVVPVLLSAAASRALAAELMQSADAVEPSVDQD